MAALGGGLRAVARGGLPAARLRGCDSRALCTGGADDGPPSGLSAAELQRRLDLRRRVSAAEAEGGSADAERAAQRSAERRAARRAALIAYLSAAKLPARRDAGAEAARARAEADASETSLSDEDWQRALADDTFELQRSSDVHTEYLRKTLMQKKLWWLVCTQDLMQNGFPGQQRRVSQKTQRARDARDAHLTLALKFAALRKWREAESKAGARRPETDRGVAAPPKPRALGRHVDAGGEDQGRQ